jgi:hypothetical protein
LIISGAYQVRTLEHFDNTLRRLKKKHYAKNASAEDELNESLAALVTYIAANPRPAPPNGRPQTWPHKTHQDGWEFWKYYFDLPGLHGDKQQGRLMYVIHTASCRIFWFWIYSHDQYSKRPPDGDLKRELRVAIARFAAASGSQS